MFCAFSCTMYLHEASPESFIVNHRKVCHFLAELAKVVSWPPGMQSLLGSRLMGGTLSVYTALRYMHQT